MSVLPTTKRENRQPVPASDDNDINAVNVRRHQRRQRQLRQRRRCGCFGNGSQLRQRSGRCGCWWFVWLLRLLWSLSLSPSPSGNGRNVVCFANISGNVVRVNAVVCFGSVNCVVNVVVRSGCQVEPSRSQRVRLRLCLLRLCLSACLTD